VVKTAIRADSQILLELDRIDDFFAVRTLEKRLLTALVPLAQRAKDTFTGRDAKRKLSTPHCQP
jgi:hypothetical protein